MRDWWNGKGALSLFLRGAIYGTAGVMFLALVLPEFNGMKKAELMASLSYAKMIQAALIIYASDNPGKSAYPADVGAKTRLEYIQYLVTNGILREFEAAALFEKHYGNPPHLKDLRPEDLRFRIANVSGKDAPDTLFLTSANYEESPLAKSKSWLSWGRGYKNGIAVLLLDCRNALYPEQRPNDGQIGALPPREPKFLGD